MRETDPGILHFHLLCYFSFVGRDEGWGLSLVLILNGSYRILVLVILILTYIGHKRGPMCKFYWILHGFVVTQIGVQLRASYGAHASLIRT